ncbi:MAG: antitoxin Xre-like helix-turn-helix domain-containing protein [Pseudomonadota bacterium]
MGASLKKNLPLVGLVGAGRFDYDFLDPAGVYRSAPHERITALKAGVPARHIDALASRMKITKESLIDTLRLSRATVNRKARSEGALSQDESERVLGMECLIGQVHAMVEESGELEGFDAAKWLGRWLFQPLPALGGKTSASFMDSIEGQKVISNLLAMTQSGAYA